MDEWRGTPSRDLSCRAPGGCRGIVIDGGRCLAHLDEAGQRDYLDLLEPGAEIDLRGTEIGPELLGGILDELYDIRTGTVRLGAAAFDGATFTGDASFAGVRFDGVAGFVRATFHGRADFERTVFEDAGLFTGAVFEAGADFDRAAFGRCWFSEVRVRGDARFTRAEFAGEARFTETVVEGWAVFSWAAFRGRLALGPLVCGGALDLDSAVLAGPTVFEAAAGRVSCARTRFEEPVTLNLRHAHADLTEAILLYPCTVTTAVPNERTRQAETELLAGSAGPGSGPGARGTAAAPGVVSVSSLRGVDASMLLLADVDLTACAFAGTHHLDQLRLEGKWRLGTTPAGLRWSRGIPRWCARRQTIEEERHARAHPYRPVPARHDWGAPPDDPDGVPSLAALTTTYRQLRKAREDAKDEPGAADFYYGEMEMRRYSRGWRHAERWLLQAYWILSGYGLHASRALGWLAGAMLATTLLMMGFGLPDTPARPYPASSGVVGAQAPTLQRPFADRFTAARAEKAADVVLNSVIFRASGQQLTLPGRYLEKAARITEPALVGLAVLAIRGRLKRG